MKGRGLNCHLGCCGSVSYTLNFYYIRQTAFHRTSKLPIGPHTFIFLLLPAINCVVLSGVSISSRLLSHPTATCYEMPGIVSSHLVLVWSLCLILLLPSIVLSSSGGVSSRLVWSREYSLWLIVCFVVFLLSPLEVVIMVNCLLCCLLRCQLVEFLGG